MTSFTIRMPHTQRWRPPAFHVPRLDVLWFLLSASLACFIVEFFFGSQLPALGYALGLASCVSCGLSWLLTRALFARKDVMAGWPYGIVSALFIACVILTVSASFGLARDGILGVVAEGAKLLSSTILLLPFFEAIDGYGRMNKAEQLFRRNFLMAYAVILGAATVLAIPSLSSVEHTGQVVCCFGALMGAALAVRHRKRLDAAKTAHHQVDREAEILAQDITKLLIEDQVFLDPEIKVNDLARQLRQPDYKITRCITQQLGFQNFNQMINTYRTEEAKRLLSDPGFDDLSILTIAMESGFGSIGPFNRAFKKRTEQTPLVFRKNRSER